MSDKEFQDWKKENPGKYEILLEDEKLLWMPSFENHKDDDVAFRSIDPDPGMRTFTFGRVRHALENRDDICDRLLKSHLLSIEYKEDRGLYKDADKKAVKDEFEKYNEHILSIVKKEANSFYSSMPNYAIINECRLTLLKKLSIKYKIGLYKCCEIVNWETFEKEERAWSDIRKKHGKHSAGTALPLKPCEVEALVAEGRTYNEMMKELLPDGMDDDKAGMNDNK